MVSVAHSELGANPRVALHARVSTEDQAERQTVQAQLDFLRKLADLHGWPIAGEYVDDGVSGTTPLDQRKDGRRLLDDARAGQFGMVVVYRLDRLGRSIRVLLDATRATNQLGENTPPSSPESCGSGYKLGSRKTATWPARTPSRSTSCAASSGARAAA